MIDLLQTQAVQTQPDTGSSQVLADSVTVNTELGRQFIHCRTSPIARHELCSIIEVEATKPSDPSRQDGARNCFGRFITVRADIGQWLERQCEL
jgi:hypothetical protein